MSIQTIHNNIPGTDYTLGFSTGLARGVDFIHQLRALAGSREQIVVVETFGNHSGYSALLIAYLAGVDRVLSREFCAAFTLGLGGSLVEAGGDDLRLRRSRAKA